MISASVSIRSPFVLRKNGNIDIDETLTIEQLINAVADHYIDNVILFRGGTEIIMYINGTPICSDYQLSLHIKDLLPKDFEISLLKIAFQINGIIYARKFQR